jgi:hypothetical protein
MEKETKIIDWIGNRIFAHHRIVSAVNTVQSISDRMLYRVLRGCWCNIIVLNVHAPSEDKIDVEKTVF